MGKGKKQSTYELAAALSYQGGADAPRVNLKGDLFSADDIVKAAKRFGVPVIEDEHLAQALSDLEIDQEIPQSLYETVAVLLREIENLKKPT